METNFPGELNGVRSPMKWGCFKVMDLQMMGMFQTIKETFAEFWCAQLGDITLVSSQLILHGRTCDSRD